jgi:phage pi2 protein 07
MKLFSSILLILSLIIGLTSYLYNSKLNKLNTAMKILEKTNIKLKNRNKSLKNKNLKLTKSNKKLTSNITKINKQNQKLKTKINSIKTNFRAKRKRFTQKKLARASEKLLKAPVKMVPIAGIATIIAFTASDIKDYCDEIKEMEDFESKVLDLTVQTNENKICGIDIQKILNKEKIKIIYYCDKEFNLWDKQFDNFVNFLEENNKQITDYWLKENK